MAMVHLYQERASIQYTKKTLPEITDPLETKPEIP